MPKPKVKRQTRKEKVKSEIQDYDSLTQFLMNSIKFALNSAKDRTEELEKQYKLYDFIRANCTLETTSEHFLKKSIFYRNLIIEWTRYAQHPVTSKNLIPFPKADENVNIDIFFQHEFNRFKCDQILGNHDFSKVFEDY